MLGARHGGDGFGIERWAFPLYLEVDVDPTLVDPVRRGSFTARSVSGGTKSPRRHQIARPQRCSSLGAMVFQLPG
jgi:hypothetical protein